MKKHALILAAFAAILTCSCSVEPVDVQQPEEDGEWTVLTAGFGSEEDGTRTVRQADGKVFWSPKDAISIARTKATKKFVSDNTEPAPTATFSGTMPSGSTEYWAVYPHKSINNFNGTYLVTSLPYQQEAVAGSFADNLFISAAYVSNGTTELTFHHQCGGLKFSVTRPGIKQVTMVPTDGDVYLAGLIGLYASEAGAVPYIRATGEDQDMSSTVVLSAPEGETLTVGAAYHIVTIPARLSGGFSLVFEKEDGTYGVRTIKKDVDIQAGHFATLMDADEGISFRKDYLDYSPQEVRVNALGGLFSIDVQGTLEYEIESYADWIREVSAAGDVRVGRQHAFLADPNEGEERTGMLTICYGDNCYPIMVTQGARGNLKVYPHHTLGMRFTATWCQYCPRMDETFRKAKEAMGDGFEYVCFYANSGNYGFPGSELLYNYYKIAGYPSAIIDGWYDLPNYSDTDKGSSLISTVSQATVTYYPTATALGIESSLSGQDLSVKVDVKAQFAEGYKLTVLLCENNIIGSQQNGSSVDKNFNHSRVARMCLTDYFGDEFDIPTAGNVKTFNFTATIPSGYKTENMVVVAYVQRNYNGRPSMQSAYYGDWYVDNCRSAAFGTSAPLEVE